MNQPAGTDLPPGFRLPGIVQLLWYMLWPYRFFAAARRRFGAPFSARFPGYGRFVFLSDPAAVEAVFRGDPALLHSGAANSALFTATLGPNSLLVLDGDRHARQRKPQVPPFLGERMRGHAGLMLAVAGARAAGWSSGRTLRLLDECREIGLEVIQRVLFGAAGAGSPDHARRSRLIRRYLNLTNSRFAILAPFVPPWFPPYRRLLRLQEQIDRELYACIASRRAAAPPPDGQGDVLADLLAMRHEDGRPLSDRELRDHLLTLLVAGHETTAVAAAWTFALLLHHPQTLARVQAELDEIYGGGPVHAAGLERLLYLDAAIKESLRLRPVLPFVTRRLPAPFRAGDRDYPAGVNLCPCMLLAHFDPRPYPEPELFRPERFLEHKPAPYSWFPFGGGARRCLGMHFALLEAQALLAAVLHEWRIAALSPRLPRVRRSGIVLAPAGGAAVRLGPRRRRIP